MSERLNILVLDLESYFDNDYSLRKLTIPEYVRDPRFHAHGIAIVRPDGRTEFAPDVPAALDALRSTYGAELEKTTVVCHNAYFDLYTLSYRFGLRPRYFVDTMLLSYHVHGRKERGTGQSASLGALAALHELEAKGDLEFMRGVRFPTVQQLAQLSDYAIKDAGITTTLAEQLLPLITRPEVELPILMHTVRSFTCGGVHVNVPGIVDIETTIRSETETTLQAATTSSEAISSNTEFNSLLANALARSGRQLPLKPGTRGPIPATAKKDKAMQDLLNDDDPVVAALANARVGLKGQDQKLARLRTLRAITSATGGILPVHLLYYGSHTGRFAGGGGFNIQNLGREGLGLRIRQLLVPRPGHVFVVGDFSQIEARVTAWLAGQKDMLEAFNQKRDLYAEFASQTFNCEVRKPRESDPAELRQRLGALRQVGKQAVLGLGFGMGALKFYNTLTADGSIAPLFARGELSPLICRDLVRNYRSTYSSIPCLWRNLEDAARQVVNGISSDAGMLRFERDENVVKIWLPSGRALRYADMRTSTALREIKYLDEQGEEAAFTPEGEGLVYGKETPIYGGKLCENVVQAVARDLLVEAVLRLEAQGHKVVFHVHDEIVVETPAACGEDARIAVEREMRFVPDWAIGCPVDCEVQVCQRYGK